MNIEEPEQLGPARETALQGHQPTGSQRWARATVLDIRCDPDVPPIPPHATFDQVKSVAGAILHGDADAWGFTKQGVKQRCSNTSGYQGQLIMNPRKRFTSSVGAGLGHAWWDMRTAGSNGPWPG